MAVVGPAAYRPAGLAEDVRLLCDSLNCIAYAFALPLGGPPRLDWLVGSISGAVVAPIKCLMDGELGTQTDLVRSHLEAAVAGNASQIELIWRDGSSGLLHLRDAVQPEFDNQGRVVRIVGTVRDVADELWSSRESAFALWQHRIVEHLDQGLACWDREGRLVLANRQFRTLGGACLMTMRPGASIEALARAAAFSGEIVVDGPPEEWIAMVLEDFGEGRYREHRLADGRSLEAIPIRVAEGTILRIHDVSSQKGGERALRDAKEIAETANLKKSRFLRAANHDLRQPLATLKILIYSSIEVQDAAHRLELLHSMDVTVSIMEEILGSLLQIGQLDAGRMTTRIVHFQMSQLMERLKIEFAPQATSKGLTFRVIGSQLAASFPARSIRSRGSFVPWPPIAASPSC
ncbi:Sensor histidine kinase RcsC [Methylorubrum aminovorans]|uniref:histidine kinase n=1 Tax=Methylorubrum aminovorans TaxID=269069 RepID=A0ABQ4UMI3_9HYPH|nr:PAS-domain containing protein [Methylorubrum aminovorans]GJE68022.1 Sensor histidine kinase RcsC [Methylorubrum aminovorans]GMA79932.1 hypothetical protein GCM10025880_63490 [Methylorubrum aminovorans]